MPGTAPLVSSTTLAASTPDVGINNNIVVAFNENVFLGTGTISLMKNIGTVLAPVWAMVASYDAATSINLRTSADTLIIDPTAPLEYATAYKVVLDPGAIQDQYNNLYAGGGPSNLQFTTISASLLPTIAISSGITSLNAADRPVITFTLSAASTDFEVTDIAVTNGSLNNFSATSSSVYTAIFTPKADTVSAAVVSVPSGSFSNAAHYANADGADANNSLVFSLDTLAPTALTFTPADEATAVATSSNIEVIFSEAITAGTGSIVLRPATGAPISYPVSGPNLIFGGTTLTINTGADLVSGRDYSLEFAPGNIKDLAGNAYTGTTSYNFHTVADNTPPTIAISSNKSGLIANQVATITFALSEPSTILNAAGIVVSGGTLSSLTGSGMLYTATFTPTANSTAAGVISVLDGAFKDTANNANADSADANNRVTLAVDTDVPVVRSFSPANNIAGVPIGSNIVVTFNKALTPGTGNIVLKTTAGNIIETYAAATSPNLQIVGNVLTIDPTTDLSYSTDYKVEFSADTFKDLAGNVYAGTTSYNFSTVADIYPPTILVSSDKPSLKFGETATLSFTLSEASTNFVAAKVSVAGGTMSSFIQNSPTSYSAVFTPTANSTTAAVISVPSGAFTDAAGNANADGSDANNRLSLPVDMAVPTVVSYTPALGLQTVALGSNIVLKFSEAIAKGAGDITLKSVIGGTTSTVATYGADTSANLGIVGNTLTIDPTDDLQYNTDYKVDFAAGTLTDLAGNAYGGTTSYTFHTMADTIAPSVTISSNKSSLLAGETATLTFTLSEVSTNFVAADVVVTGGSLANFTGSGKSYSATFTPAINSTTTGVISVPSGAFTDAANNANADGADISKRLSLAIDTIAPTVVSYSPADDAFAVAVDSNVVLNFSEAIARGTGDIVLKTAAGTIIATYAAATSTNLSIAGSVLTIHPSANLALSNEYKVEFPAGTLKDLAGNPYAGTSTYNFHTLPDVTPPTIAISADKTSLKSGETAIITFTLSEPSNNFTASDVTVTGGTLGSLTANGMVYTGTFTPTVNSSTMAVISVADGVFSDVPGNNNADGADANNRVSMTVDTAAPTVATFSPANAATGVAVTSNIDVTFSEPIALGTGNILLKTGTTTVATYDAAASTNLSINGSKLTIDPSADLLNLSDYKVEFAAGTLKDLAGNSYAGSTTYTFRTVADTIPPTIAITSSKTSLVTGQTAAITFTLSEASTTFIATDVVATGGILSAFAGKGTVYTATFTPTVNSAAAGVISVASGTFTDAAGNANADGSDADNRVSMTVDTAPPIVATFSPADEAKSIPVASNIVLTFNEPIVKGTGNIILKTAAGVTVATYDAATSTNLSTDGSKLTIDPTANLLFSTDYKLDFAAGTFKDLAGNSFAGLTTYNFTTAAMPVNQVITGTAANDSIISGTGNDTINGGAGIDTVVYSGSLANYTINKTSAGITVLDNKGIDGTDLVSNAEILKFTDKSINLTIQAKAAAASPADVQKLTEFYVAFFNRVPDADGMSYWLDQKASGLSLNKIADSFYLAGVKLSSQTGYTANMSDADFINVIYRNVLGRADGADADGAAYWSHELSTGHATRGTLVSTILSVAHGFSGDAEWGWVPDLLDNKIAVAKMISIDLGLNYNTAAENVSKGVAIAAAITSSNIDNAIALIGISTADIHLS